MEYDSNQYLVMCEASTISTLAMIANIIAAQNEKTAIIQMIGYISLIYSFLADYFIFDLAFETIQIIGMSIVVLFSVTMIIYNGMAEPKKLENAIKRGNTIIRSSTAASTGSAQVNLGDLPADLGLEDEIVEINP